MKLLGPCNRIGPSVSVQLPDLIIFRILSYLPLRSLLRFKCVCKLWYSLFLPTFLYLRDKHCPFSHSLSEDADILRKLDFDNPDRWRGFTTICRSSHDLCLQKKVTSSLTLMYRIQCDQLHDVLPIPNPQSPSLCIALEFVPIMSNPCGGFVKLVSAHEQDGNNNLGYEVLSLEIGPRNPCPCRAIDKVMSPPSDGRNRKNIQLLFRKGVAYCIWFVETTEEVDDIQVDVLDMVNETYIGHTTFPRATFFPMLSMSTTLHLLDWNGRLSFAQLLKDELHVLVLDDPTKLKWAETKRIIKLHFLKSSTYHKEELITVHACDDMSTLLFIWQHDKDNRFLCYYDIYTGELSTCEMYAGSFSDITDAELVALKVAQFTFYKAGL